MHGRLVCGESTKPPDSLQRGTRVPLRRKLGLSPLVGGQLEFLKKRESKGEGRRAGNIAKPSGGRNARAGCIRSEIKREIRMREKRN